MAIPPKHPVRHRKQRTDDGNPPSMWIECERKAATFTVRYSLDGITYEMIRQSFLTDASEQQVGMMLASPTRARALEI